MEGPSPPTSALSAFLREQLDRRGISEREAARRGGLSQTNLRHYLNDWHGTRPLAQQMLQKLADAVGVPVPRVAEKMLETIGQQPADGLTGDQRIVVTAMNRMSIAHQRMVADVIFRIAEDLETPRADS